MTVSRETWEPRPLPDAKLQKDLDYALYLRRFYLQLHPVEWSNIEIVMARIDRLLDTYNAQQQEEEQRAA